MEGVQEVSLVLGHDEPVTMTVLMKIWTALQCDIGDIMEIIPDKQKKS